MLTDPIADLLIRIKNAGLRGHEFTMVGASKVKGEILRILLSEGYITSFEKIDNDAKPLFKVQLRYISDGKPIITTLRRVSKPGRRVYVALKDVKPVMGGMRVAIITTSKGLMTDNETRKAGLGGEVLCHVC